MEISFHGKRALVTGAGKGIGRALALKLAEAGAQVVAVSRTSSDLETLKKENSRIEPLCLDISNWDLTQNALKTIGPIDLLVNNAAVLEFKSLGEFTKGDCDRLFDTNVKAVLNIGQMIAEDMKKRGKGGAIVNLSSVAGYCAVPCFGLYAATKGGVDQLTRSMALEYGPYGIRVNSINPTVVNTPMAENVGFTDKENDTIKIMTNRTPLRRLADPEDVVNPTMYLLSDKAAMVTGVIFPVDGGLSICYV